jgi:hypothetical protein
MGPWEDQDLKVSENRNEFPEGISELLKRGNDVEIFECDKSGNVRSKWLHKPDHTVVSVSWPDEYRPFFLSLTDVDIS